MTKKEEDKKIIEVLLKLEGLNPGYTGCPRNEDSDLTGLLPEVVKNQKKNHTQLSGRYFYSIDNPGYYIQPCKKHLDYYLGNHKEIGGVND